MIQWDSKELLDNTRHELFQRYGYQVTDTYVLETVRAFFSIIKKLMATTKPLDRVCNFGSIEVPGLGKIKLNENAKRNYAIRTIWKGKFKEGSSEEQLAIAESLYGYGWRFFKWTLSSGYIFVHEYSGQVELIGTDEVKSTYGAKVKFLEKIEEFYYNEGLLERKEVKLAPFNWIPIRSIYMYTVEGKFVRKYETIHDVCCDFKVLGMEVRTKLIANSNPRGFHSIIEGYIFLIGDGYVGPRIFNSPLRPIKYNDVVSMLDRNTGEVVYHRIGTIVEAAKFLKYMGKKGVIEPYYIYKKGIQENRVIYGYKWRREDSAKNDNLQNEGNK